MRQPGPARGNPFRRGRRPFVLQDGWSLPRASRFVMCLTAALIVAGCSTDSPTATNPSGEPSAALVADVQSRASQVANTQLEAARRGDRSRDFESEILRLESENPGVGGVYYDAELDRIVVVTTQGADDERAVAATRAFFLGKTILLAGGRSLRSPGVVFQRGNFAFSRLVGWSSVLLPDLLAVRGFVSVDADERLNRVRIGVLDATSQEAAESVVAESGVPVGAVEIVQTVRVEPLMAPAAPYHTLRDRVRATGSGVQIRNQINERCTSGWTVKAGTQWGFLTAAHCSRYTTGNGQTGENIYQAEVTSNDLAGTVTDNPSWNTCTVNGSTYQDCTYADVMWVTTSSYSSIGQRLALTNDLEYSNNTRGGTTLSKWVTVHASATSEVVGGVQATGARKVGRTTGYTGGTIEGTCENVVIDGRMNLCINRLEGASLGQGDSGGPVFGVLGWPEVAIPFGTVVAGGPLEDIHDWAGTCEAPITTWPFTTCILYYAPVSGADTHLGESFEYGSGPPPTPPAVSISGPNEVPEGGYCTWQAFASNGAPPYTYQWSGALSGSGSYISGVVNSSGWLYVTVTDVNQAQDNDQFFITVDEQADECLE
jgi:hypothetical protein